jgi:cysteine desulfuration protein SufE
MGEIKPIEAIETDIVDEFSLFDSWEDKYEYIIDMGKKLPALNEQYKKDENKIRGCQSSVWMHSEMQDGKVYFKADSDAMIVKGLVSMLIRVFSGHKPEEIINAPVKFIDDIGMTSHLAQTRSNGLRSMIKQMKMDAIAWGAKSREKTN